jgi:hypothetical protein
MKVFFSPSAKYSSAIDVVHPETGLGVYSGKSLDDFRVEYPDVSIVDDEVAVQHNRNRHISEPVEITEERFHEMLDVLPPSKWRRSASAESFHICERITYDIVDWFVRIGDRYYTFADTDRLSAEDVIRKASVLHFKEPA